jgi:alpha-galactosidase
MSQSRPSCSDSSNSILAERAASPITLNARHPAHDWSRATPVTFCADWQGKHPDPGVQTTVRVLWSPDTIYLRFECRYRELFVFSDSDPNGRRDKLWDRDVAEAFLQPEPNAGHYYKEFEVSPNGMWIDLDIFPDGLADLKSGMHRSVSVDEATHTWAAELSIPMKSVTTRFDPASEWRVNFYRVEGKVEPRFYSAWQPTNSPGPNFHVPNAFGRMRFAQTTRQSP